MAPVDHVDHNALEQRLKDIIQDLYQVMVQVSTYDSMGRSSREVLTNEIKTLSRSLQALHTAASPPNNLPSIPPELIEYVENGRNPDIYTREFVELVRRGNQLMRGKLNAFGSFRDVLAEQMTAAMPELREDIAHVVEATGGVPPGRSFEQRNGSASGPAVVDGVLPVGGGASAAGMSG
ncbi:RNA polymerase II mediator complex subunit [Neonectria punicea]|uniref:Mediator of RNA polymerase II transcription subunit 10 n=1 Tax=Neonectria punicea TaxID=979145 RepID=A0ABR1H194_9HYPO